MVKQWGKVLKILDYLGIVMHVYNFSRGWRFSAVILSYVCSKLT